MGSSAAAAAAGALLGGGRFSPVRLRKTKKIVVGSLFLVAMVLTGLPVLYMLVSWPGSSCCKGKEQDSQQQQQQQQEQEQEAREWLRSARLTTQQQLGALRWRHQFSSYEEYVELQMKKTGDAKLRRLWTSRDWRRKVGVFSGVFQRLVRANLLQPGPKAKGLCIGARVGQEVVALRENGVEDAIGIDLIPAPPLVIKGDMHHHPFPNATFDVEFSNVFDHALFPELFVSEIQRTLKPGGIAVIHLLLKARGDKYSTNDLVSLDPLLPLFRKCELEVVEVRDIDVFGLDTELVLRKKKVDKGDDGDGDAGGICGPPKVAAHIISQAEPLILEEPRKPWITLKQNVKKIRYLPNLIDIGDDRSNYVYIDVGSRNYASSIGSWFNKVYPKQGHNFSIFAVEADPSFHAGYAKRRGVTLVPYAAWSRNETLTFGAASSNSQDKNVGEGGMGRIILDDTKSSSNSSNKIVKVQGFDFAEWLRATVKASDYVVMKMDVEGTEFDLVPRLVDTGAMCLVDELFLECHYNRWQKCCPERTSKYTHTYADCLALFHSLRSAGLLVHQWW